jgi:cytochrome c553
MSPCSHLRALANRKPGLAPAVAIILCASQPAAAQPATAHVRDTMEQRMQACTVCHGKEGRATREGYFPRIAGKPAGYLYNQLVNFRAGRRRNATMTYLVEHMSDDYLREIARYFATLDLPYPPAQPAPVPPQALRRGQELALQGDEGRRIPACASCHGRNLAGLQPALPGIVGLPHHYLVSQLGAWKTDLRKAEAPDCMAEIARRMTEEDISAVAAWLASQTPPDAQPAGQPRLPLPLECGSGLR